ncbi:hypothetical protein NTCA1_26820 [Novosphingobium sp. TCA1]|nr:hypothetical protein NTCA1_26820 [Novosphingobium sp. TCA1]
MAVRRIVVPVLQAALTWGVAIDGILKVVAAVVAVAIVAGAATTLESDATGVPVDGPIARRGTAKPSARNMFFPKDLSEDSLDIFDTMTNSLIRMA